jgi:Tfp pilus assembly protein PilO
MQKHRIISLASILAMLIIPLLGWLLVAQPQLAAAGTADQQRADMEAQIAASATVVAQLKADSEKLPELNDDLDELRTSIPADVDSSGYLDGLNALAERAGVSVTGLTVDNSRAYIAATPPDQGTVAPAAGGAAPDPAATQAPAPPPVVDPAIVTSPLITSENFVTVPVTVELTGTLEQLKIFIQGLQSSPRLFLVSDLDISEQQGSSVMTSTIGGFIYAIPTGVPGHPRPLSTVVKHLEAPVQEPVGDDSAGTDDGSTDAPDPGSTDDPETP